MSLETLVIRLLAPAAPSEPATDAIAQWLLVDAQGARLGAALQGTLLEAAGLASGRRLIVLVPGADALQLEPVLPPMKGGAKLNQIVPYALEDQLATDVDALHFAVGKREAGPGTPVIVVSHDAMQAWIFALRAAGLHPDAIYTDSSLLPATAEGITLLIDHGRVSLKPHNGPVTTLDVAPLSEALQILVPEEPLAPLVVYISDDEYDVEQPALEALRQRISDVQIKLLPDGVLPLLALQAARLTGINLLQGVYTPRTNTRTNTGPWRYAAALLLGLVVAHLAVKGFELSRLRKQETALDREIALTYATGMPGAAPVRINEARRAFETRLLQLQAATAGNGLMLGLSTLTDAVSKSPELQLDAVSYRDNNVDLRLMAPTVDVLEGIRQQAMSRGVNAEIQSANPKDNRIEGRLQLKLQQGA
jgi:general secretion pathway protein L